MTFRPKRRGRNKEGNGGFAWDPCWDRIERSLGFMAFAPLGGMNLVSLAGKPHVEPGFEGMRPADATLAFRTATSAVSWIHREETPATLN